MLVARRRASELAVHGGWSVSWLRMVGSSIVRGSCSGDLTNHSGDLRVNYRGFKGQLHIDHVNDGDQSQSLMLITALNQLLGLPSIGLK